MKTGKLTVEFIVSLFLFLGGIAWLTIGLQLPMSSRVTAIGGPGTFPVFVTGILILFSGITCVTSYRKAADAKASGMDKQSMTRIALMVLASAVYVLVIEHAGYIVSTALFMAALLWLFGYRNRIGFLLLVVVFPVALNILFKYLFLVQLP